MSNEEIYKGYTIKWEADENVRSPRKEQDNLGIMHCWHRRYSLGDVQHTRDDSPDEVLQGIARKLPAAVKGVKAADKLDKLTVRLPVYGYDHGGLTIATTPFSCQWDSGQLGFIYATLAMCKRYFGKAQVPKGVTFDTIVPDWDPAKPPLPLRELALRVLQQEVRTYDDYLTGNVRSYTVTDPEGEEIFNCCGYYPSRDDSGRGSWDFVLDECRSEVDDHCESAVTA